MLCLRITSRLPILFDRLHKTQEDCSFTPHRFNWQMKSCVFKSSCMLVTFCACMHVCIGSKLHNNNIDVGIEACTVHFTRDNI